VKDKVKAKREGKPIRSPSKEEAFIEEGTSFLNQSLQEKDKGGIG
jgi:hypothetical protein